MDWEGLKDTVWSTITYHYGKLPIYIFVVIMLCITVTFALEYLKPKVDKKRLINKFKNRDYTGDSLKREDLLVQQQEKYAEEARRIKELKEKKALEEAERKLINAEKFQDDHTIGGHKESPKVEKKPNAAELRQRKIVEEAQKRKDRAQYLRDNLPPEPIPNDDNAGQITSIAVKLPKGGRPLQRKFLATDTLQQIVDFIESTELVESSNYFFVVLYPKRTLQDFTVTLSEAGLHPNASLLVQEIQQ